jgi:DNA-binding MarR family transcriptional regulator
MPHTKKHALAEKLLLRNYLSMTVDATAQGLAAAEPTPQERETAARLSALLRHLFLYDRGNLLRVIEDSGLSVTQSKALLELGGPGETPQPRTVGELAELFGLSPAAMSRAVDALVRKRLATRVESRDDRRVRLVTITAKGKALVDRLRVVRQEGMQSFAASLTAAQRRKLDAAIDALMDRDDIAAAYELLREMAR